MSDINKVAPIKPIPRQDILDMIDRLRVRVEQGEIRGIAASYTFRDGSTGNAVISEEWPILMLGAIEVMKRDIEDAFVELRLHAPGEDY